MTEAGADYLLLTVLEEIACEKFCLTISWKPNSNSCQRNKAADSSIFVFSNVTFFSGLFNLRGNDIPYVPVFTSYAIVSRDTFIYIYANTTQLQEVDSYLNPQGEWHEWLSPTIILLY